MSRVVRLGLFVVIALSVLAAGVFIIGSNEYLFKSTYRLKTQFDNVGGLVAGADVEVGGVHSGTVRTIELPRRPGGKVTVAMDLDKRTHEIVKRDSVASIETEGLLGNQFMAISFGSAGKPDVRDGDTIPSQPPLQMSEMLKKASGILDSGKQAMENVTAAAAHLNSVSAKIDAGQGTVGALINDKEMYNNLEETTGTMRETVAHAQAGVTDFEENMEALKHNFLLRGYFKKRGYEDSAELESDEVEALPSSEAIKTFTYPAKELFDGKDSAKLKNQKSLSDSGEFLASNQFGVAVVVASTGMEGDTQKDLLLTEARAMVVREYLVNHFGFDDSQLKTFGRGKQADATADGEWGTVQVLVYPPGTGTPPPRQSAPAATSRDSQPQAAQEMAGPARKP
jgi:phospholipid/cholesterol/gamma-HCH transport system substrate-binding protein